MDWREYFGVAMVITLNHSNRMKAVSESLNKYDVPFRWWDGFRYANGQFGIYKSLTELFKDALSSKRDRVLVFEDDASIIHSDFESVMSSCVEQLPPDWHMLFLGANLPEPKMVTRYSDNLLLTKRALALHSVAYSRECMEMILSLPKQLPIDIQVSNFIHPIGKTFVTYPFLCTQTPGWSDIENRYTKYDTYLELRYEDTLKHLNLPSI